MPGLDKKFVTYGENITNDGERLVDLCTQNQLKITTEHYKQRNIHKYTWTHSTRKLKTIIDYMVTDQTSLFKIWDTWVYGCATPST